MKPNLLFVFADQWRRQAAGYRNEDPVLTPEIDLFAESSLTLDNALSCFPLCSPNRSSMLTGRYPLTTGVTTNCKLGLPVAIKPGETSIGNTLKEAGYATGYIGKWHLDLPEQNKVPEPESGARHWDAYTPPGLQRLGFDFWYSYGAYDVHHAPHYWSDSPNMIQVNEWSLKHETDMATRFIRERDKSSPFALYVSWNPPHQPFEQVPERYRTLYTDLELELNPNVVGEGEVQAKRYLHDYYAAVTGMSEQFGRLLTVLEEEGIVENTIVVLTSDHGETMGAHGWLEHKNIWYEEAIGVPFLIRWPGQVKIGREDVLLNSVDQAPTLLGLMGIPKPACMEGKDLSDHLKTEFKDERIEKPASAFICHYPGGLREHEEARRYGLDVNAFGWRGIRTIRYTYVVIREFAVTNASVTRLLYDNVADPYQLHPTIIVSPRNDSIQEGLERELRSWLNQIGDSFAEAVMSE
ncbi:arylsulfatase A-like enzyme [Paenibacillus cellulosilyticus]|uniref:Arylsulfatase A-like enzyme n=1 Tax=Paenibacillus cellulosilyticus TaxID=375489 RepID=A0A2V2YSZ9_9BACL|nr:sulfatase [Paenibacillus cellulosilyticus]PWV99319.1 arylsulfatase A-like enzyme [Paenibacillus cellulosilyticus]QKS45084.1 sulfatase [Paenibacillus cellulosilyticus]